MPAPFQDGARNRRESRGADRQSRAETSRENHWHATGSGCEDVFGGRLRSEYLAGLITAIVPIEPALVYPMLVGLTLMEPALPMDRVETVLAAVPPRGSLPGLARELRDGGMSQAELLSLFDAARERHACDDDETGHDAILETMDLIVGWSGPSQRLYTDPE